MFDQHAEPEGNPPGAPTPTNPESETYKFMNTTLRPLLNETFDAYVIMGYVTDENGQRKKVVVYKHGMSDPVLEDAIRRPLLLARAWGAGQL